MSKSVFTIGYEGRSIDEFIRRLQRHDITVLIDVRETPASRKRGFSKKSLSEYLALYDIKYVHIRELGSPKKLREQLKRDSDYNYFFREYKKYIDAQINNIEYLHDVFIQDSSEVSCIMCMERDPFQCHRKVVAEKIKEINGNGLNITHI